MAEKLSYFDVVAYVVPGTAVVAVALWVLRLHSLVPAGDSVNQLVGAIGYVGISLIVGHLIQASAQLRFERRGAWPCKAVFHCGRPSELALLFASASTDESTTHGRRILTRGKAERVLNRLVSVGLVCEQDRSALLDCGVGDSRLRQISHQAYRTLYARLSAAGKSGRPDQANASYNLYRGLSQGSRYIGFMCLFSAATQLLRIVPDMTIATSFLPPVSAGLTIGALGLSGLWADRVFVGRAIGAGINHVREVLDLTEVAVDGLPLVAVPR